jgi:putative ABC transport system substrate-binding protein
MTRRIVLRALCTAPLLSTRPARSQGPAALPVVGFLNSASASTYAFNATSFIEGLRQAGFVPGQNVDIQYRWAENDYGRLPELARDLAARNIAVIAATGDIASARAAQSATRTIPIVFTVGSDPVPFGLVTSLSRPTGNATGVTLFSSTLMAKRFEFLREALPAARLVALLMNRTNLNYDVDVKASNEAARTLGLQTFIVHADSPAHVDGAFDEIRERRANAVLIASDPMFLGQRDRLAALSLRHSLPVVAWTREFAAAGILLSYGTSIAWMYREAGIYVGRILRGARPSDLPVIQPTVFELVINARTARSLGVAVPQALLLRADEVIA